MDVITTFTKTFGALPTLTATGPGRVNLLGEHVDYNEGPVLPAAIDRSVHLAAAPSRDGLITLVALDLDKKVSFRLEGLGNKVDIEGRRLPNWALYPAGVAWSLGQAGYEICGLQGVFSSDVPIGAGLSSSAAVEVTFAVAWQALCGWKADRITIARLCQKAENAYVGVNCGLMDQFASACGVAGHCLYFDTRSLEWEPVPLPEDTAIIVADSGVRRSLANSAYNERRASCEEAVKILQQFKPEIHSLRDISPVEFAAYSEYLPAVVRKRADHVVHEIARVQTAVRALKKGEKQTFGALMYAGHESLRNLYEVSIPELDAMVEIAKKLPGCIGARLTGAGFGGCTVNLVNKPQSTEFMAGLKEGYRNKTRREAQVYLCRATDGARAQKL